METQVIEVSNEFLSNLELLEYLPEVTGLLYFIAGFILFFVIKELCYWSYKFFNMFF